MGGRCRGSWVFACALGLAALTLPLQMLRAETLQLAVDASPAGLDPHIVTAFASFQIVNGTIYEGLTAVDKDLRIVPALAQSWDISADGKSYTFKLRAGTSFHGGSAVEAQDVVASLERVLAKEIGSPLASRLAALDKATARDAATVDIALKEPSAPFLVALSSIAIVPRKFQSDKETLQRQPDGTGPFKFKEWQPNSYIELARNDAYWKKGQPKLDGVRFNIVPEAATRQVGLTSGQYAMLPNVDAATWLQLKTLPNIKVVDTLELAYTLVGMNVSRPPLDDPRVRQALNYSLDRNEMVQAALFGSGVPGGPLSPALVDWAVDVKSFPCYATSTAKAAELLKAAGVATPIKLTMLVLPRQDLRDIAQVVQQQLQKAGFQIELKIPELGQFVQDWRNSNFDLFASSNAGSPDPDDYFYRAFHTGGSTNVFKYSDAEVDRLLDEGRSATTPAARRKAYDRLQTILACTGPAAHLTYGQLFTAMRSNVLGFDIIANRSLSTLATVSLAK
jgi:peptide/nickel transport system substrate-binding protein